MRSRRFSNCADALPDAPRRFPLGRPDRQQHLHDVGGGDAVYALGADLRHGIVPEAGAPLGGGLAAVLPVLGVDPDDLLDGLLEGRSAAGAVTGVAALGDEATLEPQSLLFSPELCQQCLRISTYRNFDA